MFYNICDDNRRSMLVAIRKRHDNIITYCFHSVNLQIILSPYRYCSLLTVTVPLPWPSCYYRPLASLTITSYMHNCEVLICYHIVFMRSKQINLKFKMWNETCTLKWTHKLFHLLCFAGFFSNYHKKLMHTVKCKCMVHKMTLCFLLNVSCLLLV